MNISVQLNEGTDKSNRKQKSIQQEDSSWLFLSILAHSKQDSRKAGKKANLCKLTGAVEFISIQQIPYSTAADKATNSIGTDLFTTSIDSVTLIDVWKL